MKQFYTADTHFDSKKTIERSLRPFKSVEEMNRVMIDNWNKIVGVEDHVYHLGDFGNPEYAEQLNGHIHLLLGNHEESRVSGNRKAFLELTEHFYEVFEEDCIPHNLDDEERTAVALVHEPSKHHGFLFTLFGHIHKLQMVKKWGLNVGMDCHNFAPIPAETVIFYKNRIEHFYDDDVFCG